MNPSRPVIAGVGQLLQRPDNPADASEASALMAQVVQAAAADAGQPSLSSHLDCIAVVGGGWGYPDPGRLVAESVGAANARTVLTGSGGNVPQAVLSHLCRRIQDGELDVAVVVGAEIMWSRRKQKALGSRQPVTKQEGVEPDERFGSDVSLSTQFETSRGLVLPIDYYPLAESALRANRGESIDNHRDRISGLWHRFNQVAVDNPYAWRRESLTAEEIRNAGPGNRMVGFPYTKAMNSNWDLDQAAAVLLCSVEAAERFGVPKDRWVFPLASAEANDTPAVSHRRDFHSSPAIEAAGKALFHAAETKPDDIEHVDLYSCFPVAVQIAAAALGFDENRQLTQTGGLTFAGGPLNNYVTHSIATLVERLRADPASTGLATANGGFVTKHALGLYSAKPTTDRFITDNVQAEVDQIPPHPTDEAYSGPATIEAYTVMHNAEGPTHALCAVKNPAGARTWGRVLAPDSLQSMMIEEAVGQSCELSAEGEITL